MPEKPASIPVRSLAATSGSGIAVAKVSAEVFQSDEEARRAHRHDYHFFVLQEKGVSHTEIDFEEHLITKPSVLYQSPSQVHRALRVEDIEMYILIISNEHLHADYILLLQGISPAKPLPILSDDLALVRKAFALCTDLYERNEDKLYLPRLKDSCNALVALIISLYLRQAKPSDKLSRYETIGKAFNQLLEDRFTAMKRPADYADALNISVTYLNECVRNTTGHSVSYHIQQRIVLEAKRLLYHSDQSVKEIAATLGYEDYPYFSRLFTKVTGMTALAFRKKNRA